MRPPRAAALGLCAVLAPLLAAPAVAAEGPAPLARRVPATLFARAPAPPPASRFASILALPSPAVSEIRGFGAAPRERRPAGDEVAVLSPERARVLLRSLTVPGWGQATIGHGRAAAVFALAEAGVWGSFTAFRIQEQLRRQTYERTARLFAGIDLRGRDEAFRRIVGWFPSSEVYNRLVVFRDAFELYRDQPELYRAYIAAHEIKSADAWAWDSPENWERYRGQRKQTQRAALRANAALALAIANRLVSAAHAARVSAPSHLRRHSWRLEAAPVEGADLTAFRLGVRARF